MQIAHGDMMQRAAAFQWREGNAGQISLLVGPKNGVDNFLLSYGEIGDYYAPRHRHNFEQIRVQLKGEIDFARDGKLTAGTFGYFPEGLPYGPQSSDGSNGSNISLVLQCGGSSGCGYISQASATEAYEELGKSGTFEGGIYRTVDADGKQKGRDAFQALWEHVCGQRMTYPRPRYANVFLVDPERFAWVPNPGQPGVFTKDMGSFTERGTRMGLVRVDAGARFTPHRDTRDLYYVLSGRGRIGDEDIRQMSAMEFGHDEAPAIDATEELTLILFGLPDLRGLSGQLMDPSAYEEA